MPPRYFPPSLYKTRRCNRYTDNGEPIENIHGLGCFRSSKDCTYVHPDEPEWENAQPPLLKGYPPPHPSARPPSPYGPPRLPSPPLKVEPRERIPSISSAHGAHGDRDVDMHPPRGPRGHSPAPSIASSSARRPSYVASGARTRDEEKDDERGRYRDDDRRRSDERRYEDRSRDRDRRRDDDRYRDRDDEYRRRRDDRSRDRRSRSSSRGHGRSSSSRHRRPSSARPPPKVLTEEEKRKLWLKRIDLLSKTVQSRSEHLRLHEDMKKYERLTKSAQYESMPVEDKVALQKLLESATSRFQEKQHQLNRLAGELIPEDFWPHAQRAQHAADPGYQKIIETLAGLRGEVERLHGALASVQASQPSTAVTAGPSAPTAATAPASNPEPGEISNDAPSRPKKRRRLSTDASVRVPDLSAGEAEQMQDQLAELTHRISELRNDFLQYDSKIADEVEAELDYRLAGLKLGVGGEEDKSADPELQEKLQTLLDRTRSVDEKSTEALADLTTIKSEGQKVEEERAILQTKNDAITKSIEETLAKFAEMSQTLAAHRTEIHALSQAITAIGAQGSHPPLPPAPLTAEEIVEAIRPQLLNATRDDLNAILEDVRAHIQKELQEQSKSVSGDLMTQMGPVVRSVEWISAWIDRIRGPNSTIVTTSAAGSSTSASASTSTDKGKGVAR
ncbi:hypothetical protein TRAPUB_1260 [Trametes pubescens]|uniref:C3H1-type domain-containing protein n=1 Tax=Trametes pubescens TaxID=154538 RepID=A0A1M2VJW0_TRAPU|nr:hypothetical protein TRAPUB_1260 [Trametes pubescens]